MGLSEAVDVLKKCRKEMESVIKLGFGTDDMEKMVNALDVVIDMIC